MINIAPYIHYLLDILEAPAGNLPDRADPWWEEVFALAVQHRIDFILTGLVLERWGDRLPSAVRQKLTASLSGNTARNILLARQIRDIHAMFESAGIPCIFLKGAACLIRGLYPPGWRFLSDLDIQVQIADAPRAFDLLVQHGFQVVEDGIEQAHHLQPLRHPKRVGTVEIHTAPYALGSADGPVFQNIWDGVELHPFQDGAAPVPCPADHLWILVRTDLIDRVAIPRMNDAVELFLLAKATGYSAFDLIIRRAEQEGISNYVKAFLASCSQFGYPDETGFMHGEWIAKWNAWSIWMYRKERRGAFFQSSRKRFGAVLFVPEHDLRSRIIFFRWMSRQMKVVDRFIPGKYRPRTLPELITLQVKLVFTLIAAGLEYALFRLTESRSPRKHPVPSSCSGFVAIPGALQEE